ncbi:hypothetical protein RclHR1_07020004 [Rhizophagus clarus]|uniref:Uncharacterized protein n=1 Tax=Rhizophagus clarus TaxID=94130 RepID=A0A2Z6RWR8_9GLOM|nr:hypothetical protein RclHR1_07020004 [Rhizophagus clarus]GET03429.1 hypothetical protein GLOIN_2v1556754 [Rhizophagus clarus]
MAQLVGDVLLLVFTELHDDLASLYSCTLVNTTWCHIAVPLLWKHISFAYEKPLNYKLSLESREKLYNVIAHFIPNDPKDPLPQNNIILPLKKFSRKPIFEYMNFFTRITPYWIKDMVQLSINDKVKDSKHKKNILEQEIYKLIFNKCNNVKHFYWDTKKKLYRYPNAKSFFSNLRSLEFNFEVVTSKTLFRLAMICQNITNLEINDCDEDFPGLVSFIKIQNNLQSLRLHFDDEVEEQYTMLSNIIKKKASILKTLILNPIITLISPIFIPSLKNIQYLILSNDGGELYESVKWREWEYYLTMSSFPYLQHLEVSYLPSKIVCLIVEKSGKNISEIIIRYPLESDDYPSDNKNLIKVISNNCSKLVNLTMNVDSKNLKEMGMIFSNCKLLEKIYFTTNVSILPDGDELLRVLSNISPKTLREFSFGDKWNFSLKGLESFFESWKRKNKFPIKFIHYYDEWVYSWTDDHDKIVEKYKNEKVIR